MDCSSITDFQQSTAIRIAKKFRNLHIGNLGSFGEVSFHPAHLEDSRGRLMPKALVPLCSYQGTMLGKKLGNFTFCDKFKPRVLNGQLCY